MKNESRPGPSSVLRALKYLCAARIGVIFFCVVDWCARDMHFYSRAAFALFLVKLEKLPNLVYLFIHFNSVFLEFESRNLTREHRTALKCLELPRATWKFKGVLHLDG